MQEKTQPPLTGAECSKDKNNFYQSLGILVLATTAVFVFSAIKLPDFMSFHGFFFFGRDLIAFFCSLGMFFVGWRSWRAQREWGFLNYDIIRNERKKLKQNKQRFCLLRQQTKVDSRPDSIEQVANKQQSQPDECAHDSTGSAPLTQHEENLRSRLLWDLCFCEWVLSTKTQRSFRWYLFGNIISLAGFLIPMKGSLLTIVGNIMFWGGYLLIIIAFFIWIISIIEAA